MITVVETPFFQRKASAIFDEEEHAAVISFIAANPEAGRVMPEAGGIRKLRWKAKGKGKSEDHLLFPQRVDSNLYAQRVLERRKGGYLKGRAK